MEKIVTIFERERLDSRGRGPMVVVPKPLFDPDYLSVRARPTEKLDGMNVRLTVRSHVLVRLEARMNPSKALKTAFEIREPWYRDAWVYGQQEVEPQDGYLQEAALSTDLLDVPDGEWSAEAVGPKIQGNPLDFAERKCYFFDRMQLPPEVCVPVLQDAPTYQGDDQDFYDRLHAYLNDAPSTYNHRVPMEGIVWHEVGGGYAGKIKRKDFPHYMGRKNHGVLESR